MAFPKERRCLGYSNHTGKSLWECEECSLNHILSGLSEKNFKIFKALCQCLKFRSTLEFPLGIESNKFDGVII